DRARAPASLDTAAQRWRSGIPSPLRRRRALRSPRRFAGNGRVPGNSWPRGGQFGVVGTALRFGAVGRHQAARGAARLAAFRRTRLIVVNSPANPTGGVFTPEDLEQIAWWADRRDVLIFSDEVFERFVYDGESLSIGTLPKAWRRTLTAGSVSKGYGLAAARVGWLAGHRHLIRPCMLTAVLQAAWPPTLCQQIALATL